VTHALIIDDNMIVGRAVRSRLEHLGFTTFDQAWTEHQALAAAGRRRPDLVVIGDAIESGSAIKAARTIAQRFETPVLMVTGDSHRLRERCEGLCAVEGPYALNQIDQAVDAAFNRDAPGLTPATCD
jgi:DNA-binding response OmpR family regulator